MSDYLITKINWKVFILPCFIGGMVGFELFGKINKLAFWLNIYNKKKDKIMEILSEDTTNDSQNKS